MTENPKSRSHKNKRHRKLNHPLPTKHPNADFTPTITDVTQEGECFVIVGGVQPPTPKAAFVPVVSDETVPGECTGIIAASRSPKKTTRPSD
jgi:hypothetical protein